MVLHRPFEPASVNRDSKPFGPFALIVSWPVSRREIPSTVVAEVQGAKPELESLHTVLDARNIARSSELGCLCWRERPE
jgi:hypothetical protein